MHRQILGVPKGVQVDHRNHNGLDNQRGNLQNQRKRLHCSSQFKGVHWLPHCKRWQARILVKGKRLNLGYFTVENDAGVAYQLAAKLHFGEFAGGF